MTSLIDFPPGALGVTVQAAQVAPGQEYWRLDSLTLIPPERSGGNRNIYVMEPHDPAVALAARNTATGGTYLIPLDKPLNEPAANLPMWGVGNVYSIHLEGYGLPSDGAAGLAMPQNQHVSYEARYTRARATGSTPAPEPTPRPVPVPIPAPGPGAQPSDLSLLLGDVLGLLASLNDATVQANTLRASIMANIEATPPARSLDYEPLPTLTPASDVAATAVWHVEELARTVRAAGREDVHNILVTVALPPLLGLRDNPPAPRDGPRPASEWSLSQQGLDFIKSKEAWRATLYNDAPGGKGSCTIGWGHKVHSGPCDGRASEEPFKNGITLEQGEALLRQDVARFVQAVRDLVTVPLTQSQFDALVSFAFNAGIGSAASQRGLAGSRLLLLLNSGDYEAVPGQLARYNKSGGSVMGGLIKRRAEEGAMFAHGAYP